MVVLVTAVVVLLYLQKGAVTIETVVGVVVVGVALVVWCSCYYSCGPSVSAFFVVVVMF